MAKENYDELAKQLRDLYENALYENAQAVGDIPRSVLGDAADAIDQLQIERDETATNLFDEKEDYKAQLARAERLIADLRAFVEGIRDKGQGPIAFRIRAREILARAAADARE